MVDEVDSAETRGLGAYARAAELQPLAREHSLELVGQLLIHTEEVANLASAHANVASRHVLVGADVSVELGHEGLAEAHHLGIRASADREVGASLAAAHGQGGECVLESLLEAEELQYGEIYRRVEAQATFVGADGTVELHAIAEVNVYLALVVSPGHSERDDALRLYESLHELCPFKLRVLVVNVLYREQHLAHCLQIFQLARMLLL